MRCLDRFLGLLVVLGVVGCVAPMGEEGYISLKKAERVVLWNVLNNNTEGIKLYELEYRLNEGDTVYALSADCQEEHLVVEEECWFFLIDNHPGYRWAHECRFVFVYCSGNYKVTNQQMLFYLWKDLIEVDFNK